MGNAKQALAVIINTLGDMEEAGMLLEHTVGNIDPLQIVNMVPDGLEIPRLRDRLVKIITDCRTRTSLRQCCNAISKWQADSINFLIKYYKEARHAVWLSNEEEETRGKRDENRGSETIGRVSSMKNMELKSKSRGGGRCSMCFDPLSNQDVSVIIFLFCLVLPFDAELFEVLNSIYGNFVLCMYDYGP